MWKFLSLSIATLSLIAPLAPPGKARAGEKLGGSCQVSGINIAVPPITDIINAPPISFSVSMTCTVDRNLERKWLSQGYKVGYCWHIHNYPTSFNYRSVGGWRAGELEEQFVYFNLYEPNGLPIGGGDDYSGPNTNVMGFAQGGNGVYYATDTITLRFENNNSREPLGKLRDTSLTDFHGGMTAVRPNVTPSAYYTGHFCKAEFGNWAGTEISGPEFYTPQVRARPKITVEIKTFCNIRQPYNVSFGKYPALRKVKPVYATVNVSCSAGTHYRVAADYGRHSAYGWRYMTLNGGAAPNNERIYYSISPASWEGIGDGASAGISQRLELTVPDQPTPPPGIYRDTLVLTLEQLADAGNI